MLICAPINMAVCLVETTRIVQYEMYHNITNCLLGLGTVLFFHLNSDPSPVVGENYFDVHDFVN